MKTAKFTNVAEAAAHLAEDPSVAQLVKNEIVRNELVSALIGMRLAKGFKQEKIAEAMGCDPSTISRIESGNDRQLKWTDVEGYVSALKVQMNILFDDPSLPTADRIKQCVFKIHEHLESLASLANEVEDDPAIVREIDRFYKQVLFNFLARFQANYQKLPCAVRIPHQTKLVSVGTDRRDRPDHYSPKVPEAA